MDTPTTAPATDVIEFKLLKKSRVAYCILGTLLIVLVITAPVGIWVWFRAFLARAVVTPQELRVKVLLGVRMNWDDVKRLGLCAVPVQARNLAQAIGMMKVGGSIAMNVCVMNGAGQTKRFIASSFADQKKLLAAISKRAGKPYEVLPFIPSGAKWPAARATQA